MCGARRDDFRRSLNSVGLPRTLKKYLCKSVIAPLRSIKSKPEKKAFAENFWSFGRGTCVWRAWRAELMYRSVACCLHKKCLSKNLWLVVCCVLEYPINWGRSVNEGNSRKGREGGLLCRLSR